jgi:membrane protease YdiL (CAAX protease family)
MYLKRLGRLLVDLAVPLLAIGLCIALYRFGVIALVERLVPAREVLVTILRRVGVVGSLFFGYWVIARYHERRRLNELAFRPLATAAGAVSGIVLIGLTIVSLFALDAYQLVSVRGYATALPVMGTIVLIVMVEEAVFRGIFFRLLEQHAGTLKALVVQALAFGALHLFNEGTTAMTMISVTLLGAFWTLIYVHTRNLWVVIAHHAAWNLTIFTSGVPLSGQEGWRRSAPLESAAVGPGWLTGGGFGPEDSILNVFVMACAVCGLGYWVWRQKAWVSGSWSEESRSVAAERG